MVVVAAVVLLVEAAVDVELLRVKESQVPRVALKSSL